MLHEGAGLMLVPEVDPDTCHSWTATRSGTEEDDLNVRRLQGEGAQTNKSGSPWR